MEKGTKYSSVTNVVKSAVQMQPAQVQAVGKKPMLLQTFDVIRVKGANMNKSND